MLKVRSIALHCVVLYSFIYNTFSLTARRTKLRRTKNIDYLKLCLAPSCFKAIHIVKKDVSL